MESETGTLLFKKFRCHIMQNYLSDVELLKKGFLIEIGLVKIFDTNQYMRHLKK